MFHHDVNKFIDACDQKESDAGVALYASLIYEEFQEFVDAVNSSNDIEQLDACMDMIWVILGYCHMKGYKVDAAWAEVARSNHAKIDRKTGKVLKRADGKVLKPEDWKKPDFSKFVGKKNV